MAIAKMKKLTLLAEQQNKENVFKSVQEMQNLEVIPLPDVLENELVNGFSVESTKDDINQINQFYQDLEYNLSYLDKFVDQPGLIEGLRRKREVFTLKELESHVENVDLEKHLDEISTEENKLKQIDEQKKDLKEEEFYLRKWKKLDFYPNEVGNFRLMDVVVGSVDVENKDKLLEEVSQLDSVYYNEVFINEDDAGYYFITPKTKRNELTDVLNSSGFQNIDYSYSLLPNEQIGENQEKRRQLIEEEKEIKKQLKTWTTKKRDLELAIEYFYNKNEREKAKELILNSKHLFILSGWVEESKVSEISNNVETNLNDEVAILTEDIPTEEEEQVPTVLENNSFVKSFESIVEMYSLPKYNDFDPTPWIAPFFFLFFGMMSADAGYGILLNLATLVAIKFFTLNTGTKNFLRFLHVASYATIIVGLIFGSFFGFELPIVLIPLTDQVMPIMIFSVAVGIIQLILGLLLNAYVKHKEGDHAGAYVDGYSWALILLGFSLWGANLILGFGDIVSTIGIWLMLLNVIGMVIVSTFANKNKLAGFGSGLYGLTSITTYVGDIVSYTRLMALAVASANIAIAFNIILGLLPVPARFTVGILLFIVLHAVNIFIAYLSAYVHSARLMYVEFFGKFYEGGGRAMKPLRTLEEHIWLNKEK